MNFPTQLTMRLLYLLLPLLSGCVAVIAGGAVTGANVAHDRRSFGTVLADKNIQWTAADAINHNKEIALKNNVYVIVYDHQMLLIGEVRTEALKQRSEELVSGIQNVRRLVNEIAVQEPENFGGRRRDDLLTAKVKAALLDIIDLPHFDPSRVNVSSAHRVIYLMGRVSHAEDERVTEIARNVRGVERVIKLFEYMD